MRTVLLGFFLCVIFISCGKKPKIGTVHVDGALKKHFLFKPGSYWIYEYTDSLQTSIDSLVVDSVRYGYTDRVTNLEEYIYIYANNYSNNKAYRCFYHLAGNSFSFSVFFPAEAGTLPIYYRDPPPTAKYQIDGKMFYNVHIGEYRPDNAIGILKSDTGCQYFKANIPYKVNLSFKISLLRSRAIL